MLPSEPGPGEAPEARPSAFGKTAELGRRSPRVRPTPYRLGLGVLLLIGLLALTFNYSVKHVWLAEPEQQTASEPAETVTASVTPSTEGDAEGDTPATASPATDNPAADDPAPISEGPVTGMDEPGPAEPMMVEPPEPAAKQAVAEPTTAPEPQAPEPAEPMASPSSEPAPTDEADASEPPTTPPAESASAGSAERDEAPSSPAKTTTPAEAEPAAEAASATAEPEPPTLQPIDDPVATAQRELNAQGYNAGPVDGIYGPKTRTALLAFQEEHDLEQTGRPDPDTLEAMGFRVR